MTRRTIQVGSLPYIYSPDEPLPVGRRLWGVMKVSLFDEITSRTPDSPVSIATTYRGLIPKTAEGGALVGLTGIPANAFPNLRNQPYPVPFTVAAAGYVSREDRVTIPSNPTFPDDFTPVSFPDMELHRVAVGVRGRTAVTVGTRTLELPGTQVRVTGYWPTLESTVNPPQAANMLWIQPPLYFRRSVLGGIFRRRDITPVAGQDKSLLADAPSASTLVRLSDSVGAVLGGLLIVDPDDAERTEYMTIGSMVTGSTPDQAATVTLTYPLAYAHRVGTRVRTANVDPVLPPPAGFSKQVDRDALAGDEVLFLNDITNVSVATVVEVTGGPNPREFHRFRQYATTSNADGYFSLPPISRVAQLRITATNLAHPALPARLLSIRYGSGDNRLDFIFR